MKEGPNISIVAALIGNPACANMLMALLSGPALTATELAQEAGLSLSTVSGHLDKLAEGLSRRRRASGPPSLFPTGRPRRGRGAGRLDAGGDPRGPFACPHRPARSAAAAGPHLLRSPGGRSGREDVRPFHRAAICWRGAMTSCASRAEGQNFFSCAGIDIDALDGGRRPLCRPCLDWSERRISSRRYAGRRDPRSCRGAPLGRARCKEPRRPLLRHRRTKNGVRGFRGSYFT